MEKFNKGYKTISEILKVFEPSSDNEIGMEQLQAILDMAFKRLSETLEKMIHSPDKRL